jgi:hypothetical protein
MNRRGRPKNTVAAAMSQQDGCIVIIMNNSKVIGSLTRTQTLDLAHGCIAWRPTAPLPPAELQSADAPGKPILSLVRS